MVNYTALFRGQELTFNLNMQSAEQKLKTCKNSDRVLTMQLNHYWPHMHGKMFVLEFVVLMQLRMSGKYQIMQFLTKVIW